MFPRVLRILLLVLTRYAISSEKTLICWKASPRHMWKSWQVQQSTRLRNVLCCWTRTELQREVDRTVDFIDDHARPIIILAAHCNDQPCSPRKDRSDAAPCSSCAAHSSPPVSLTKFSTNTQLFRHTIRPESVEPVNCIFCSVDGILEHCTFHHCTCVLSLRSSCLTTLLSHKTHRGSRSVP